MPDINGKPWALVAETRAGSCLIPDGDFDCIVKGAMLVVQMDEKGSLYVPCTAGEHHLAGQLSEDGTEYVGFWLSPITVEG